MLDGPEPTPDELVTFVHGIFQYQCHHNCDEMIVVSENYTRRLMALRKLRFVATWTLLHHFLYFRRVEICRELANYGKMYDNVGEFDYLCNILNSSQISDIDIVRALYYIKNIKYDSIAREAPEIFEKAVKSLNIPLMKSILDLGCGTGFVGGFFRKMGFPGRMIGVDVSEIMLEKARKSGHYDDLICGDLFEYLGSVDIEFDCIVMLGVSAHLSRESLERVFLEAGARLGPRACLLFDCDIYPEGSEALKALMGTRHHAAGEIEPALKRAGLLWRFFEVGRNRLYRCQRR